MFQEEAKADCTDLQPGPDELQRPQIFTKQKPDAAMTSIVVSAGH